MSVPRRPYIPPSGQPERPSYLPSNDQSNEISPSRPPTFHSSPDAVGPPRPASTYESSHFTPNRPLSRGDSMHVRPPPPIGSISAKPPQSEIEGEHKKRVLRWQANRNASLDADQSKAKTTSPSVDQPQRSVPTLAPRPARLGGSTSSPSMTAPSPSRPRPSLDPSVPERRSPSPSSSQPILPKPRPVSRGLSESMMSSQSKDNNPTNQTPPSEITSNRPVTAPMTANRIPSRSTVTNQAPTNNPDPTDRPQPTGRVSAAASMFNKAPQEPPPISKKPPALLPKPTTKPRPTSPTNAMIEPTQNQSQTEREESSVKLTAPSRKVQAAASMFQEDSNVKPTTPSRNVNVQAAASMFEEESNVKPTAPSRNVQAAASSVKPTAPARNVRAAASMFEAAASNPPSNPIKKNPPRAVIRPPEDLMISTGEAPIVNNRRTSQPSPSIRSEIAKDPVEMAIDPPTITVAPVAELRRVPSRNTGPPPLPPRRGPRTDGPQAMVLADFAGEATEGELGLFKDEVVYLNRRINAQWFSGELSSGEHGIFPANHVKVTTPLPNDNTTSNNLSQSNMRPYAIGLYDFEGENDEELSFFEGETITLLEKVSEEWYKGETNDGKIGIFPCSYVEIKKDISEDDFDPLASSPSNLSALHEDNSSHDSLAELIGKEVRAMYDYDAETPEELAFKTGDLITVIEMVNDEWLKGSLKGKSGIFPLIYVETLDDQSVGSTNDTHQSQSQSPYAVALYEFEGSSGEELSFKKGDKILLMSRVNAEWYEGENDSTYTVGIFPSNYVDVKVDLP